MLKIKKNNQSFVAKNILKLMEEAKIREAELARQTGLPQTTINRLLQGETPDPRTGTLKPIAKYFGVSIDSLIIENSSFSNRIKGTVNAFNRDTWSSIPIIPWENILSWKFVHENFNTNTHNNWITTEKELSTKSFAIKSKPFMEPRFRKNSILVVDPDVSIVDGKFVVISVNNEAATVKQVLVDGASTYLKSLNSSIPTILLDSSVEIIGVIVEARINLD